MGPLLAGFPVLSVVAHSFLPLLQGKDDSRQVSLLCNSLWTLGNRNYVVSYNTYNNTRRGIP
jgi:hypothetical protein